MSVEGNFQNVRTELSKSEIRIINYILANPDKALGMTVQTLANAAGSSPATVSRMTRRLHFNSYNDLKVQLATDLSLKDQLSTPNYEIKPQEDLFSIKKQLLSNAKHSIEETVDQISEEKVETMIKLIRNHHRILLFGVGASYLVAQNIAQKWARLGFAFPCSDDLNQIIPLTVTTDPKETLVWVISNSGESPECVLLAKLAKKADITVIATTKLGSNDLIKYADVVLQTSQPLEEKNRFAATQSLHAQFMLIDVLFYAYVSRFYDDAKNLSLRSKIAVTEYKDSLRNGFK